MPEEHIKEHHESELRNDTISKMLYLCKRIEQFGSGFKRIDSLCKDAKVKYSYENTRNGFKFILYRNQIHSDTQSDIWCVTKNGALWDLQASRSRGSPPHVRCGRRLLPGRTIFLMFAAECFFLMKK